MRLGHAVQIHFRLHPGAIRVVLAVHRDQRGRESEIALHQRRNLAAAHLGGDQRGRIQVPDEIEQRAAPGPVIPIGARAALPLLITVDALP